MKKEAFIAIFLGVVAGIGVAVFMIIQARQTELQSNKSISTSVALTPKVSLKNTQFQPLELSEPENNQITSLKTITIKGKAAKGSLLVIQSATKNLVQTLESEEFVIKDFPVSLGENAIRVTVYPTNLQILPQEKELKIYYLDEQ